MPSKRTLMLILFVVLVVLLAYVVMSNGSGQTILGGGLFATGGAPKKKADAGSASTHLLKPAGFVGEHEGKPVDKRHVHWADLDADGNGVSTRNFGHTHEIRGFKDMGAGEGDFAHTHGLGVGVESM